MSSPQERARNNARAGVFVSVALLLAVGVVILLTDVWETLTKPTDQYTVTFDVAGGVSNLKEGADVRVGGVVMGKVLAVRTPVHTGVAFDKIDVDFSIFRPVVLYADAQILVTAPLIGADAWLDIPSVGTPDRGSFPEDGIAGIAGIGALTTLLGPENAAKAGEMLDDAKQFTEFLATMPEKYDQQVVPILDNAHSAAGDLAALTETIRQENWPRWSASVDNVMDWANSTTGTLDDIFEHGRGILADNRPKINTTMDNVQASSESVREVTQHFNDETSAKIDELLDTGKSAMDTAVAVLEDVNREFDAWVPDIRDTLANARLAAQQLKLTGIEVRRSPWKLFHQPSMNELEHELLYGAARSFALAASDLKAASESMRRVLDYHSDQIAADPQTAQRLNTFLLDSLTTYEKAQQDLIDVLLIDSK
ncbi:MAG: hypothetical protein V3T53_15505 [Phycisphaerales bacterium]